jgi:hypothetical protein
MADTKISALPAASLPLAGTEVLPIVQSSTTVKATIAGVQAAPVTAGTANGVLYLNGSKVPSSGTGLVFDGTNFGVGLTPATKLDVSGTIHSTSGLVIGAATDGSTGGFSRSGGDTYFDYAGTLNVRSGAASNRLTLTAGGDLTVDSGNLVIGTSNRGVTLPGGITWTSGAGSPEGVVTAPVGSLYSRSDGGLLTSLYVKQSGTGNTGWAGK